MPSTKYEGGPELIAVAANTELKATTKPYPTSSVAPDRVRIMVQSVDNPIWVSRTNPATVGTGWYLPVLVPMAFSGPEPVYAINAVAAASVNVWESGPE
jgi:hypothetical protein